MSNFDNDELVKTANKMLELWQEQFTQVLNSPQSIESLLEAYGKFSTFGMNFSLEQRLTAIEARLTKIEQQINKPARNKGNGAKTDRNRSKRVRKAKP